MQPRRLSTGSGYQSTGALNTQVQIMQRSTARDSNGDFLADQVFATCWARVQSLSRKYTDKPDRTNNEATAVVYIRYIPGITKDMKVKLGNTIMLIEGPPVDPDGRQVELQLFIYERKSAAS